MDQCVCSCYKCISAVNKNQLKIKINPPHQKYHFHTPICDDDTILETKAVHENEKGNFHKYNFIRICQRSTRGNMKLSDMYWNILNILESHCYTENREQRKRMGLWLISLACFSLVYTDCLSSNHWEKIMLWYSDHAFKGKCATICTLIYLV